jgi:hypothetical protein
MTEFQQPANGDGQGDEFLIDSEETPSGPGCGQEVSPSSERVSPHEQWAVVLLSVCSAVAYLVTSHGIANHFLYLAGALRKILKVLSS